MGLRINTNISAINAQRNLQNTTNLMNKTLEKLSTGLRINKAADDAAGIAIATGLTSQVRALDIAQRNANDGISMVQTAESAISEQVNIGQRLRELAVQAANGTMSDGDRALLAEEVEALLTEFDRIATQTTFNGVSLLNGFFGTKEMQVGSEANQTISMNFRSTRTSSIGAIATHTGSQRTMIGDAATMGLPALGGFNYLILNGITISSANSDNVSSASFNSSALALAEAINNVSGSTGVTATARATVLTAASAFTAGTSLSTGEFKINKINITGSFNSASTAADLINNFTSQTGVEASVINNRLILTAPDGRNIVVDSNSVAATQSAVGIVSAGGIDKIVAGSIKLHSSSQFTIFEGGSASSSLEILGITSGTEPVDASTTALNTVSILSISDASNSIDVIDSVLDQLNVQRAQIGATQNRLEITKRNLAATSENLSAAKSRIMDSDIAAETAELTKSQILQQAGIAVLAQANMTPQAALSLLK